MIRTDHLLAGKLLICLWITISFVAVTEGRRYDKCTTSDGREGVCVIKRYCREASQHELLPCEQDEENHCCPIPTSQRSAPSPPPYERHRTEKPYKPPPRVNRHNTVAPPEPSKTPSQANGGQEGRRRPVFHPNESDKRDQIPIIRPPIRDPSIRQPVRDPPIQQPSRGYPARQPGRPPRQPAKPVNENPPITPHPAWNVFVTDKKNRTTDDTAPITFQEPNKFSVARPRVPACGVKPYDLFIAGGQESAEHEWPWMTAIFRRYPDSRPKTFLCGGSLINTRYVLTAAHCFVNNYVILPASSFVVRLGSHFLDSGEEYTVANLVIHNNHSGSDFFNDIALVRLASEVYITDKIAPICLPSPDMMHQSLVGRLATVSGWGDTAFRTSGTRILQHVTVPIVSGEECFAAYSRVRGAAFLARGSEHVVCAGLREGGKDACLGDSGGPLMMRMSDDRWIIVGIVSLGYKCAEPGYPGVYTRVTHYMSWIHTNMKRY